MIHESALDKKARRWWDNLSTEGKQKAGGAQTYLSLSIEDIKRLYIKIMG